MGYKLRRVALDFQWPLNKPWQGFLNPFDKKEMEKMSEDWEPEPPPSGEGYQVWETVSEGSPISPVFAAPEELAKYMANHPWGADKDTTYEQWLAFILGPGHAFSLVVQDGRPMSGVQAAVQ